MRFKQIENRPAGSRIALVVGRTHEQQILFGNAYSKLITHAEKRKAILRDPYLITVTLTVI